MDFADLPLRDIHLPEPVSWFPPGPGVWALLMLAGLLLAAVYWMRRRTLRRAALAEYARIASRYRADHDTHRLARDLSALVRRVAIARAANRRDVAGLTGHEWLAYLARTAPALGEQSALVEAPYARNAHVEADALLAACREFCTSGRRRTT